MILNYVNDWMDKMVSRALQPYVGSVGLKLYYPDSVKIQHDGIVNCRWDRCIKFMEDDRSYYFDGTVLHRIMWQ